MLVLPPSRAARLALALGLLLAGDRALAHETFHEIQRGRAIAVKGWESDGELLADRPFEIYSPADAKVPHQKGRTDRGGWVAFLPDAPGKWRVRVFVDDGHGLDVQVDADAPAGPAPAGALPTAAFVLRPLVGLLAIGAVFGALVLHRRRRGTAP